MISRAEARTLLALLRGVPRNGSPATKLEAFYAPQAQHYDRFRERLLAGRPVLLEALAPRLPEGGLMVELGAGTGQSLELLGTAADRLGRIELVDLCPSLLAQAARRAATRSNVGIIEADACRYRPDRPADVVLMSYSLSMIPDWTAALDNALGMLRPGGLLAVADFYVSRPSPPPGWRRHGALARAFWPRWFAHDGVHPSSEHLPLLAAITRERLRIEGDAPLPWLPLLRAPWYAWIGRKDG